MPAIKNIKKEKTMKKLIMILAVSALLNTLSFAEDFNISDVQSCVKNSTVIIDSQEMPLNSERAMAETINELPLATELAPTAQKLAICFGETAWTILSVIENIYYDEATISVDNIAIYLKK